MKDWGAFLILAALVLLALGFVGFDWARPFGDIVWSLGGGLFEVLKTAFKGIVEALAGVVRGW